MLVRHLLKSCSSQPFCHLCRLIHDSMSRSRLYGAVQWKQTSHWNSWMRGITVPSCGFWNWRPVRFMDSCISNSTHGTLSHLSARPILQISSCQTKLSLLMDFPHPVLSISSKTACVEASGTNVLPWPYLRDVAKVFLCRDRQKIVHLALAFGSFPESPHETSPFLDLVAHIEIGAHVSVSANASASFRMFYFTFRRKQEISHTRCPWKFSTFPSLPEIPIPFTLRKYCNSTNIHISLNKSFFQTASETICEARSSISPFTRVGVTHIHGVFIPADDHGTIRHVPSKA